MSAAAASSSDSARRPKRKPDTATVTVIATARQNSVTSSWSQHNPQARRRQLTTQEIEAKHRSLAAPTDSDAAIIPMLWQRGSICVAKSGPRDPHSDTDSQTDSDSDEQLFWLMVLLQDVNAGHKPKDKVKVAWFDRDPFNPLLYVLRNDSKAVDHTRKKRKKNVPLDVAEQLSPDKVIRRELIYNRLVNKDLPAVVGGQLLLNAGLINQCIGLVQAPPYSPDVDLGVVLSRGDEAMFGAETDAELKFLEEWTTTALETATRRRKKRYARLEQKQQSKAAKKLEKQRDTELAAITAYNTRIAKLMADADDQDVFDWQCGNPNCSTNCLARRHFEGFEQVVVNFVAATADMNRKEKRDFMMAVLVSCAIPAGTELLGPGPDRRRPRRLSGGDNSRWRYELRMFDHRVCSHGFRKLFSAGDRALKNIKSFIRKQNGFYIPKPSKMMSKEYVEFDPLAKNYSRKFAIHYIESYAKRNGFPCPRGRGDNIHFLHSSIYYKDVWKQYQHVGAIRNQQLADVPGVECCDDNTRDMALEESDDDGDWADKEVHLYSYPHFLLIWHSHIKHVKIASTGTDFCELCTQLNADPSEKHTLLAHMRDAYSERMVMNGQIHQSRVPDSNSLHYSFDHTEDVYFPSFSQQDKDIFFNSPFQCALFGLCCETTKQNYVFALPEHRWPSRRRSESDSEEKPSVKKAYGVISMIDCIIRKEENMGKTILLHACR
jgi:hypothetical protein